MGKHSHPIFSRMFTALVQSPLAKALDRDRMRLLDGTTGRIVEIGAGTGANFAFYPPEVTEVVAVEPEPYLRAKAEDAARRARITVTVVDGTAEAIPLPDASVDGGVGSLVLCSVESVTRSLEELLRVIRPGGELRLYEHVAGGGVVGAMQKVADATVWPHLCGGCHTGRDTVAAVEASGFVITRMKRMELKPLGIPSPITPHVLITATRP